MASSSLVHNSNAVRLTVRYIKNAIGIDEHAVRARESTLQRIWLGTIASLSGAKRGCDNAGIERDASDDVVLGVGHKEPAVPIGKSLGTRQLRKAGRPAVARIALLAGTGQMMNRPGFRRNAVDRIAFAKRKIKIAFVVESDRSLSV